MLLLILLVVATAFTGVGLRLKDVRAANHYSECWVLALIESGRRAHPAVSCVEASISRPRCVAGRRLALADLRGSSVWLDAG